METTAEKLKAQVKTKRKTSDVKSILLRRKNRLIIDSHKKAQPTTGKNLKVMGLAANVASFGYILSPDVIKTLETLTISQLKNTGEWLVKNLSEMVGANVKFRPLFRNFPEDVPDVWEYYWERVIGHLKSELELTENARLLSCGHLIDTETFDMSNFGACPICQMQIPESELLETKKRKPLNIKKENIKYKVIELGLEQDVLDLFKNLVSSNTSVSVQDTEDISDIFVQYAGVITSYIPEKISQKEILALIVTLGLSNLPDYSFLKNQIKTATDVLRIATSLSGGDVSLAKPSKFKRFNKTECKFFLTLLENCGSLEEDMKRYHYNWLRMGEILHPGNYKIRFPKTFTAFTKLRNLGNGEKIETFNSKTESLILEKKFMDLTKHLSHRPGEFARKLDLLLASTSDYTNTDRIKVLNFVNDTFKTVIHKVSTPVLLQVMSNFKIRNVERQSEKDIKVIMPKGSLAKVKVLPENRKPLHSVVSYLIEGTIKEELKKRFSKLPAMGKVYLDPDLSGYVVPASQRSASKSLVTIPRGSQIDLGEKNTVRMFTYWKESGNRADIDLSAIMFDEDWNYKEHISYTNYHGYNCTHSGDIQSAPMGAAEFIDIDKESVLKYGGRYVAMNIYSYTGQPFTEMEKCFSGFMGRKHPKSGEIFEPKTVEHKFDISAESTVAIPIILDLKENKMIWADLSLKSTSRYNNIESNKGNVKLMAQAISKFATFKTNIYDLLKLHVEARGTFAETPEEAELIFSTQTIPNQLELISSEFIS